MNLLPALRTAKKSVLRLVFYCVLLSNNHNTINILLNRFIRAYIKAPLKKENQMPWYTPWRFHSAFLRDNFAACLLTRKTFARAKYKYY